MSHTVMVIVAHPDDEAFGVGGTMARLRQEGHAVTVVCATRGEAGEISDPALATPETLGSVREAELRSAMAKLGVTDVRFLDYRDSGMDGTPENDDPRCLHQAEPMEVAMDLTALMQEVNPDVVITWDASGGYGHPDHITVHHTATEAFGNYTMRSGKAARLYYMALPVHLFGEMAAELTAKGVQFGNDDMRETAERLAHVPPTTVVDVQRFIEVKRAAVHEHRSQNMGGLPLELLSEDLHRRIVGYEYFHQAQPPRPDGDAEDSWFF